MILGWHDAIASGSQAALAFLGYQLLGPLPSVFLTVAYYRVWQRTDHREIPLPFGATQPIPSTRSA